MSDEKNHAEARKKRVQRLKHYIIITVLTAILVPWILCIVLSIRFHALSGSVEELSKQNGLIEQQLQQAIAQVQILRTEGSDRTGEEMVSVVLQQEPKNEISASMQEPAHKVYLTFDDGPSAYTEDILDILAAYEVKATFFVVGKEGADNEAVMKRIVEEGHSLGMHSYSHVYGDIYKSVENFAADLDKIRKHILEVTGVDCKIYRFPGGSSNKVSDMSMRELGAYLHSRGIEYFDWNISGKDASQTLQDTDTIVHNSIAGIEKKKVSVILLHDAQDKPTTVEALPEIIENILAMPDTVLLPITEETEPVQHIHVSTNE